MRNISIASILIGILTAVGMTPAAGPADAPTSQQAAEVWVRRADRDLARLSDDGTARYEILEPNALAIWTYESSPTDARRAAAVKLIRQYVKAKQATCVDGDEWRLVTSRGTRRLGQADALGEANQMLAESQQPTTLPTTRPDLKAMVDATAAMDRAYILVRLGKADDAGDAPLEFARGQWYLDVLRDGGHDDDADALDRLIQPTDPDAVRRADYIKARELARAGYYEQALVTVENGNDPGTGCRTAISIGEIAVEAGATQAVPRVRAAVEKLLADPKVTGVTPLVMLEELTQLCGVGGDKAGVDEVVGLVDRIPRRNTSLAGLSIDCEQAMAFSGVNEPDRAAALVDKAVRARADMTPGTDARASADLFIAAAYARAGDRKNAAESATAAFNDRPAKPDDPSVARFWNTDYGRLVDAYLSAGLTDDALRLAKTADPPRRPVLLEHVVFELVAHAKPDDARKITADLPVQYQAPCYGLIAAELVKQNKTDGLADWVDKIPTPQVRIAVDVAVANAITGRRNHDFETRMRVPRAWQ